MKKITEIENLNKCPHCGTTDEVYAPCPIDYGYGTGSSDKNFKFTGGSDHHRICKKCKTSFSVSIKYHYDPKVVTEEFEREVDSGVWA